MASKEDYAVSGSPRNGEYGSDEDMYDDEPGTVAKRYQGTAADKRDMQVLGKQQVLRRNFRFITMLGFGSTVICSWEVVLPYGICCYFFETCNGVTDEVSSVFTFVLIDGGTALLFWGFI